MKNVILSDSVRIKHLDHTRELPPQSSAKDTSNWENRPISLPDPSRPLAQFIRNEEPDYSIAIFDTPNPYVEQEELKSQKNKK